eukprot:TRINITY_DN11730_c0_g1_i1.p1 TRINITY_DN11730_c0_g1~~TRINITY_DN11730_c0_g1_i1.p1  ORF type:complete len:135 (+),score=35.28 TRINITY_DN11730_c0_g1_i1:138-542(+)
MLRSLVGSEMCIRDRFTSLPHRTLQYFDEAILSPILEASLQNYTTSAVSALGKGAKRGTTDKPLASINQDSSSMSSAPTTTTTEGDQQILERALNRAIDQMGGGNGEGIVHGHIGGDDNAVSYTHLTLPTKRIV